jgi:hypothetical protein
MYIERGRREARRDEARLVTVRGGADGYRHDRRFG